MAFRHINSDIEKEGVKVLLLHPGVIRSDFFRNYLDSTANKIKFAMVFPLLYFLTKNVEQGSQTSVYCSIEDINNLEGGGYYGDCKKEKFLPKVMDDEQNKKVFMKIV